MQADNIVIFDKGLLYTIEREPFETNASLYRRGWFIINNKNNETNNNKLISDSIININKNRVTSYVGYTNDLVKRLALHNKSKGAKFTKGRKWTLIYKKCYKTKSLAMKNEYILKKNQKKRNLIKKKFIKNI